MVNNLKRQLSGIVAFALVLNVGPAANADVPSNFIDDYIALQGGCSSISALLRYEKGMNIRAAPFGKAAEKWTEDDFATLQHSLDACIGRPTARSQSEERKILDVTRQRVEAAKASYDARQKQEQANQADFRSHRQERLEADAARELSMFGDHVMSPAEVERVADLLRQFPSLSAKVKELYANQTELQQEIASGDREEQQERAAAAGRIEAEKQQDAHEREMQASAAKAEAERRLRQQALDAKLKLDEARAEAERQQAVLLRRLPDVCQKATSLDAEQDSQAVRDRALRAMTLAAAGDTNEACVLTRALIAKQEEARADFVECAKVLENSSNKEAQDFAVKAFEKAINIHMRQIDRQSDFQTSECR